MNDYFIPGPEKRIFLFGDNKLSDIQCENPTIFQIEKIDYSDGIKRYFVGAKYPMKGFPTPEAIWSCNIIKRMVVMMIRFPILLLFVNKTKLLQYFNEISFKVMKQHFLSLHYLTPVARELHFIVKTFMTSYGFDKDLAYQTAVVVSHLFEYDNAYRYRLQDLMSEVTHIGLAYKPHQTIKKLIQLVKERDGETGKKLIRVFKLISLLLYIPKIRKTFEKTLQVTRLKDLQYDDADKYWTLIRNDYKYQGLTYEERIKKMDPIPQGYKI